MFIGCGAELVSIKIGIQACGVPNQNSFFCCGSISGSLFLVPCRLRVYICVIVKPINDDLTMIIFNEGAGNQFCCSISGSPLFKLMRVVVLSGSPNYRVSYSD